jgi:transmembrane sensor
MERHPPSKLNSQIYAEACEWFVECRSGNLDPTMRRDFDRWLRKSPEHLSAYMEIAAIWNEGPFLDPHHQWDPEQLIAQAAADHDNVIPVAGLFPASGGDRMDAGDKAKQGAVAVSSAPSSSFLSPRWRVRAIAASTAVVGLALGMLVWSQLLRAPTYTTRIGEQRSVALADGSTVELNSRTKVKVRYSERERAIELLEGQALFRVATDHARPFIVTSDATRVRAVGTQFDVYKKRSGTVVTVIEGRVAILTNVVDPELHGIAVDPPQLSLPSSSSEVTERDSERDGAGAGIFLTAGEQVTVTRATVQEAILPNIAGAIAWRQRQLVFESASLSEVAEEFNRYNEKQLVVRGADLDDFHISGVFSSTDPASLIRFLRERPEVQIIETPTQIQVAKKIHEEVTDL